MRGSTILIVESFVGPKIEAILEVVDVLFTVFIAGPLIIIYWKATWALIDMYIYPDDRLLSAIWTTAFGMIFGLLLSFFQEFGKTKLKPDAGKAKYFILTRLYTCFAAVVNVAACRGVWNLLEFVLQDTRSIFMSTIASTLAVMALRTLRNVNSAPFGITVDAAEDYFEAPTFYKTSSRETALYILDCVFSVTVVGSLVVFVWRGSWALLDIFLYPHDQVKSFWTSLVVGYSLVILTFAAQAPVRWAVAKLQGAPRLLLADVYHLISFFATVNVWRGIWGLLDVYFFPDSPKLSNWSSHIASLVLLILLNCSNSILVRGVYIDAEEPAGDCVEFPCHYLRLFFQKERVKNRRKTLETTSAANARKVEEASVPLQIPEEKV
ncbi:uncharacterized protein fusl isoform X2 [Maniola hyperantus]|uniref:uncharacterized protein fusl isoform X2 n=1 Tax=Aphantopus hyperantus TaxID=2795564 RepID=UPI001568D758|nr:uncharacterized protein LOC117984692 isoform X2 [Maniola hyperantus]